MQSVHIFMATMADDARQSDASGEKAVATTAPSSWRYCLHIAYFGTGFVGWQRQQQGDHSKSGHESVQEVVELAVTTALGASERVNVTGVSRTDTGTHALCVRAASIASIVPVLGSAGPILKVTAQTWSWAGIHGFSAEDSTSSGFAMPSSLQKDEFVDMTTLRTIISAEVIVRRHDSEGSAAVATGEHKRRKVERPSGGTPVHFVCVELVANGFLRHMVRRIIGTLRPIGEGTFPPSRVQQVLAGEIEPGPSAPSKALWLHRTWLTQEDYDGDHATKLYYGGN
ncbi:hypothetical protein BBJ28_00024470 [Nothophytophthora sp. Chile5]|nr:hypothetical protein BBJ28_00024470 [Nothophytophthora sp. Chile5]